MRSTTTALFLLAALLLGASAGCGDNTNVGVTGSDARADAKATDGADRTCTYKGEVYQDQQQWKDDCNACKCNPEGTTGPSCTQMACPLPDGGADDGGTTCGGQVCPSTQVCVHPCCGGAGPRCLPKPEGGTCPAGTTPGCQAGSDDGCREDPCTPPPPYCADTPPVGCTLEGRNASCTCA